MKQEGAARGSAAPSGAASGGGRGTDDADWSEKVQEWATKVGTFAAAIAGLVIVVHLLGGTVMWLRFRKADLPADQALAFMTREQMLTIGLRLIVLPVIIACAVAVVLVWAQRRKWGRPGMIALRAVIGVSAVLVLALLLAVPVSWTSLTWLALAFVVIYLWPRFKAVEQPHAYVRIATVAVLAAALISLGRQIDDPVQLLQVDVALDGREAPITRVFVGVDDSAVYVGDPDADTIEGYRRSDVRSIALGPPLERAPNRSILSHLLSDDRWSITPLRWWCNGEEYSWRELGQLCKTQPKPLPSQRRMLDIRWIPVRVRCPSKAEENCRGYLRLRTQETYSRALGPQALPRRVEFPREGTDALRFAMPPGRTKQFCVTTTADERSLLRARPDGGRKRDEPVPLDILISSDPDGESAMSRDDMVLDVFAPAKRRVGRRTLDPSLVLRSGCSDEVRRELARQQGEPADAKAEEVLDPVTFVARTAAGPLVVRLLGVEACRGSDAADRVEELLARRRRVRLEPDRGAGDRDPFSRLLRHVELSGRRRTLQEELLRSGWFKAELSDIASPARAAALRRAARVGRQARRSRHLPC